MFSNPSNYLLLAHILSVIAVMLRVVMLRVSPGVVFAWILLVSTLPGAGVVLYLLLGERRIGRTRQKRMSTLGSARSETKQADLPHGLDILHGARNCDMSAGMDRLGRNLLGNGIVSGNRFELFAASEGILQAIIDDIDAAQSSVVMEFYIWNQGGLTDDLLAALVRAAKRGVKCHILIDALGAKPWWRSKQPVQLRKAGVEVRQALPVGLFRTLIGRTDLRLHRKIVVIDHKFAWTGSMNLVDPRFFKKTGGFGEWVDAMVRLQGAVVASLAEIVLNDWYLETGESIRLDPNVDRTGKSSKVETVDIQVIPSGPGESTDGLLQMLLALVNGAVGELILTTPYFVPDESLLRAIRGAAARGVSVSLIVPQKVDSFLTRFASRSYYQDLVEVGAKIYLFQGGLLHTKSITVDGRMAMFGTVNLDMRSLWLNYEIALFTYGEGFVGDLKKLQESYIENSVLMDQKAWESRPQIQKLSENVLRLFGPVL